MIIYIAILIVGFVVGALVARNNQDEVNKVVEEAKELAAKAEAELKELKAASKEAAPKRVKKPATKAKK